MERQGETEKACKREKEMERERWVCDREGEIESEMQRLET